MFIAVLLVKYINASPQGLESKFWNDSTEIYAYGIPNTTTDLLLIFFLRQGKSKYVQPHLCN